MLAHLTCFRSFAAIALAVALGLPATSQIAHAQAGDYDLPITSGPVESNEDPVDVPEEDDAPKFYDEEIPTTSDSVIYVVDRSSSMDLPIGTFMDLEGQPISDGTRLDFVKTELIRSVRSLPRNFTFNIMIYSECIDAWREGRVDANDVNKGIAEGWIHAITPYGWTNTGGAAARALADRQNRVIMLLSDGAPNFLDCAQSYVGDFETHRRVIRQANGQGCVINCFGIGLDAETRSFMQQVAADNGGTFRELD
jgi:hypothetical protein